MRVRSLFTKATIGLTAAVLTAAVGIPSASAATIDHKDDSRGVQTLLATSKVFRWGTLRSGDCEQDNGTLTIRPNGSADFSATTLTYQTHTHDVWWATFVLKTSSGTQVYVSPTFRSPDMSDGNPSPRYFWTAHFTFDRALYRSVSRVTERSTC